MRRHPWNSGSQLRHTVRGGPAGAAQTPTAESLVGKVEYGGCGDDAALEDGGVGDAECPEGAECTEGLTRAKHFEGRLYILFFFDLAC